MMKKGSLSASVLCLVLVLAIAECAEKNKATHVRVQDRSEPIRLSLDDSLVNNHSGSANDELYKG